jgi:hypothetical protein
MKPFDVSPALEPLREAYPSADAILTAARGGNREARHAIARLWLSEGIPYSFRASPGVYEALRRWLARRLDVHAKEITLVGSGRQGFCLSPGTDLGRPFGDHSDLDLTVVCQSLFDRLEASFARWAADYTGGGVPHGTSGSDSSGRRISNPFRNVSTTLRHRGHAFTVEPRT